MDALIAARSSSKPTFINIRTIIGFGSTLAGTAEVHGAALGVDEVARLKKSFGLNPNENFHIPDDIYEFFCDLADRGETHEKEFATAMVEYQKEYPDLAAELALRIAGKMPAKWTKYIPSREDNPTASTATRKSAGILTNALAGNINSFLVGTADLTPSCNVAYKDKVDFQSVSTNHPPPIFHSRPVSNSQCSLNSKLAAALMGTTVAAIFTMVFANMPCVPYPTALQLSTKELLSQ